MKDISKEEVYQIALRKIDYVLNKYKTCENGEQVVITQQEALAIKDGLKTINTLRALTQPTAEDLRQQVIESLNKKYNEEVFYNKGRFHWRTKNAVGFVTFERLLQTKDYENVIRLATYFMLLKERE